MHDDPLPHGLIFCQLLICVREGAQLAELLWGTSTAMPTSFCNPVKMGKTGGEGHLESAQCKYIK